jgi:hypothetical protein
LLKGDFIPLLRMTWFGGNKKNIIHRAFAERERKNSERDEKKSMPCKALFSYVRFL